MQQQTSVLHFRIKR